VTCCLLKIKYHDGFRARREDRGHEGWEFGKYYSTGRILQGTNDGTKKFEQSLIRILITITLEASRSLTSVWEDEQHQIRLAGDRNHQYFQN